LCSSHSTAPLGLMSSSSADVAAPISQLICRVSPSDCPTPQISVCEAESRLEVGDPDKSRPAEVLQFDRLFTCHGQANEQEQLFEAVRSSVLACLHGTSLTVVAHGCRQSGKSYALTGFLPQAQLHGIVPRATQELAEAVEAGGSPIVALEASFYELRHDGARDLLACNCPQVGLRELAEPPYVVLDSALSVTRWEAGSTSGFGRLLEAYYAGLEQRRKGGHACFQIACERGDGRARTHVRFVEMAWPRVPSSSSVAAAHTMLEGVQRRSEMMASAVQGAAAAAIEQVVQSQLAGHRGASAAAYRSSPLALMLKPCFEGSSALCFIHCLRPEASQVSSLAASAPLLAKIHLWLNEVRASRGGTPQLKGLRKAPSVPRLPLGTAAAAAPTLPPSLPEAVAAASPASSSPPAAVETPQQDLRAATHPLLMCMKFLTVKRNTADALAREASLAGEVLQDLSSQLRELHSQKYTDPDDGPTERETLLKIVYERVFRSLRRTAEELARSQEDIEALKGLFGDDVGLLYDAGEPLDEWFGHYSEDSASKQAPPAVVESGSKAQVLVPTLPLGILQQQQQEPAEVCQSMLVQSFDTASDSPSSRSNSPLVSVMTPPKQGHNRVVAGMEHPGLPAPEATNLSVPASKPCVVPVRQVGIISSSLPSHAVPSQSHGSPLGHHTTGGLSVTQAAAPPACQQPGLRLSGAGSAFGGLPSRAVPTPARATTTASGSSTTVEANWPGQTSPPAADRASWPRQHSPPATLQRSATMARLAPAPAAVVARVEQPTVSEGGGGGGTPLLGTASALRKSQSMAVLPSFSQTAVAHPAAPAPTAAPPPAPAATTGPAILRCAGPAGRLAGPSGSPPRPRRQNGVVAVTGPANTAAVRSSITPTAQVASSLQPQSVEEPRHPSTFGRVAPVQIGQRHTLAASQARSTGGLRPAGRNTREIALA